MVKLCLDFQKASTEKIMKKIWLNLMNLKVFSSLIDSMILCDNMPWDCRTTPFMGWHLFQSKSRTESSVLKMQKSGVKCPSDEIQKDFTGLHEQAARWQMSISTNRCCVPRETQSKPCLHAAVLKPVS